MTNKELVMEFIKYYMLRSESIINRKENKYPVRRMKDSLFNEWSKRVCSSLGSRFVNLDITEATLMKELRNSAKEFIEN